MSGSAGAVVAIVPWELTLVTHKLEPAILVTMDGLVASVTWSAL